MSFEYEPTDYSELSSTQKENYNYHKICALLVEYGFSTQCLNDDWKSTDFITQHAETNTFLKIQLKDRLTFDKKYIGKDLHIAFRTEGDWFLIPHDELLIEITEELGIITGTSSWMDRGVYSFSHISTDLKKIYRPVSRSTSLAFRSFVLPVLPRFMRCDYVR